MYRGFPISVGPPRGEGDSGPAMVWVKVRVRVRVRETQNPACHFTIDQPTIDLPTRT